MVANCPPPAGEGRWGDWGPLGVLVAKSPSSCPGEEAPPQPKLLAVKDLTLPAEFSLETMQQFIDWNRSSPYKVERGEGECAI